MSVMMKHWSQHGILSSNQHVFQNKIFCTQLLALASDFADNLDNAEQTDELIFHLAKAFDIS